MAITCLVAITLLFDVPAIFTGKVIAVSDGDTITVLVEKTQIKVRLDGIDCPESKQAFGQKAKEATSHLVVPHSPRPSSCPSPKATDNATSMNPCSNHLSEHDSRHAKSPVNSTLCH